MADDLRCRPYSDATDLRAMQELVVRDFADTYWRCGDLAWAARESTQLELSLFARLLFAGEELIGWTWVRSRGLVEMALVAGRREVATYEVLLEAGEAVVTAMVAAGDPVSGLRAYVPDDDRAMERTLTEHGYAPSAHALVVNRRSSLHELPEGRPLPAGWSRGAVEGDELVHGRVECHRAAFAPSELTVKAYRRVRATWPYRPELDRVILDGGGKVVAACTAWLDEANGDGLLEPVATHPSEQGQGLGRAVCIDALTALREAGARTAQVGCAAGSAGCRTYAAIGFEPTGRITEYQRPLTPRA